MELSPMRPLHRGAATAAALLLSAYPPNRLTAQRPLQATDYYKLVVVANPALSPDGRRVAFAVTTVVEDKDKRHSEIWMASADGSGKPYRYTSPATEASSPRWSPDGSLLAFTSKREGADDDAWFLRTGAPGGEAFQIAGVHALPVFSPDGRAVVFVQDSTETVELDVQPRPQLYVLTLADRSVRRLETGYTENASPAWSPDGKWIAFECSKGRGEENDVCVMPAGGGAVRNLTGSWDLDPGGVQWSRDSKTVYCFAETRGNLHLFAAAAGGGPVRQVTTGERQLRGFSFSADGKWLTYTASDVTRPTELYVAPAAGGRERRAPSFNGAGRAPPAITPADTFWFAGAGGWRIEGWLMSPPASGGGKKSPLVLSIPGGPHGGVLLARLVAGGSHQPPLD